MANVYRPDEWLVIVNPNAGKGRGQKHWDKISNSMREHGILFNAKFTGQKGHATLLVKDAVEHGCRNVIVAGGDGTLNEAVNGILTQNICRTDEIIIGMIPVGTGNDWGKMFGIPSDYEEAVKIISRGRIMAHDAGRIVFRDGPRSETRYFINIAGLGFDAIVVRKTNLQKERGKGGRLIYFYNLLSCLLSYKGTRAVIIADDNNISDRIFTVSVGNGIYSGGGMRQTPGAVPDDGLLNITIIRHMSISKIILSLKKLYDGTILEHPRITGYACRKIFIDSEQVMFAEADGESLGHTPVEIDILPRCLKIIYGRGLSG